MKNESLTIPAKITREQFREFAVFDALRRQKRWTRPAAFAVFFCALAALAFSREGATDGAALLGGILLLVGLGLPAAYFGNFFLSVRKRARQLDPNAVAYTLTLTETAVEAEKDGRQISCPWERLFAAYRLRRGVCLYTDPRRAFLLPDEDGAAWQWIAAHTSTAVAKDLRG